MAAASGPEPAEHLPLDPQPPASSELRMVSASFDPADVTDVARLKDALRAGEDRLRALVESSSDTIGVMAADGAMTFVSRGVGGRADAASTAGEAPATAFDLVLEEDRWRVEALRAQLVEVPGSRRAAVFRFQHPDGSVHVAEASGHNLIDDPAVGGVVVNIRDVTAGARAEALLAAQARILTSIASGEPLESTLAAIATEVESQLPGARCSIQRLAPDGHLVVAGTSGREALLCALSEGADSALGPGICASAVAADRELLVADPGEDRRWNRMPCLGAPCRISRCWATPLRRSASGAPVGVISCYFSDPFEPDDGARRLLATATELAALAIERKRFEEELSHQALHDPLTGLANRGLLLERFRAEISRGERHNIAGAVLLIDLDRFKAINDSLGHPSGDAVLQEMAKRISREVRTEDTVARLGGDEFVVTFADLQGEASAVRLAERLLAAIRRPLRLHGRELHVSASIGIAVRRPGELRPEVLLRNADTALYRAKERGRDRWDLFDATLRKRAVDRLRLESSLRRALDGNELEVWYQPVCSISEARAVSVEALVRWRRSDGRLVGPGAFVPIAEETGLIGRLGARVLTQACEDLGTLDDLTELPPLELSVNASGRQLVDGSLVPLVRKVLAETGLNPHRLRIELTESSLLADLPAAVRSAETLRELGVGIVLDDFGTGYSSLSLVKQIPNIQAIKIDRTFVSSHPAPEAIDRAVIRASLALSDASGANVVAEGVETPEQLLAVRRLGVDLVQGYLVGRPMSLEKLRAALPRRPWQAALLSASGTDVQLRILEGDADLGSAAVRGFGRGA